MLDPSNIFQNKGRLISRRMFVLSLVQITVFISIVSRLFYLQISENIKYRSLSDKNRLREWKISPSRGIITDFFGKKIAENKQVYQLHMMPEDVENIENLLFKLSRVINFDERRRRQLLKKLKKRKAWETIIVAENLSWAEFSRLNIFAHEMRGVKPVVSIDRKYFDDGSTSHIIGYVSYTSKKDLENNELNTINDNANIIEPSNIRKIIAERTAATKQEVPHFYLTVESKVDKLISLRNKININNQRKISYNDLIVKAIGLAIHKNPKTNVSWINNKIHMYRNVDISVAVALDDGLITPIVRNAQNKGINEISNEIKELVNKAKHNKLVPDEYTGGSITVSNLGMYGITEFSAIINPPQSSIIAIGAIIKKPIIVEEKVLVGHTMKSTLSADHRAIDGAIAGKLIKDFNDIIENPFEIWLNCNDMKVI